MTAPDARSRMRQLVAAVGQGPTHGRALTRDEARFALEAIMDGLATPAQAGALLLLQRYRGEAADELLGYADAVRGRMRPFHPHVEGLLDVGSPYDGRTKHIVVSPAASIVAAAAGASIVMHGEPDMGPKLGVAVGDVLAELGVDTDLEPSGVARGIETCGLGYVRQARLAPDLHALMPMRAELGLRTPLHMVEKIFGPGGAPYRIIGVAHMPYLKLLAPVMAGLRCQRTLVVQGMEGHEDVPTSRGARVVLLDAAGEHESRVDAAELGLEPATDEDLAGSDAAHSARITVDVLEGRGTAGQRVLVVLNAALRLYAAARVGGIAAGIDAARAAIASGEAMRRLEAWRRVGT